MPPSLADKKTRLESIHTHAAVTAFLQTNDGQKVIVKALNQAFTEGSWEIPDDAIVGIYAAKIDQLEAQNKSLLELVKQLAAEVRGEPIKAGQRIDAIAATSKKPASKK